MTTMNHFTSPIRLRKFCVSGLRRLTCLGLVLGCCTAAVADDAKTTDATKKVTYEDDVKPILREHCLSCHHQGEKKGGLALDTFSSLMEGGGSGEIVYDDGDPDGSRLWQLVNHDDTPVMPPKQPKMAAEKLAVIQAWIEGGILENMGSKAKAKKKNALAFVAPSKGKPEGPPPMPKSLPQKVPVVTQRASAITAIGTSPWAPLAAVAGQKQISLYHTESGELLGILPFEEGIAQSLRFSNDGQYLIAGGGEHSVRGIAAVYKIETGERVATVGEELDTVFDADVNDTMSRIALGGPQKMLRIFDATDGTLLFDIKKHTDWIYAVTFSPDGILVASADRSGGVCVWEADTGRLYLDLTEHKAAVTSLSWRDDSNVLASSSEDGTVKLWDMNAGKSIKSINIAGGGAMSVRFDHKGQIVVAGKDKKVRLFDGNGKQLQELPPMSDVVLEAALTHDSSRYVYGDWTGEVRLTSAADSKVTQALAANPPSAEQRMKKVQETLASIQAQLAPLAKTQADAAAKLATANKAITDAEAIVNQKKAAVDAAQKAIVSTQQQLAQRKGELPALVSKSRDQHDGVIAARIALGDSTDAGQLQKVADLEIKLAEHLTAVANNRRGQVQLAAQVTQNQQQLAKAQSEVAPAEANVAKMREATKAVQVAFDAAKKAHDAVAAQMSEHEKKKQSLAAAIQ